MELPDSSTCASGKLSPSGSPASKTSFVPDTDSDLTPNISNKDHLSLTVTLRIGSVKDLKGVEWNEATAHVVYRAFGVKRYKVDEEHILCPVRSPDDMGTVTEILEICDKPVQENPKNRKIYERTNTNWLEFMSKMDQILEVFRGEAHLLSSGVTNGGNFILAERSLLSNMRYIRTNPADDPAVRDEEAELQEYLKDILEEIRVSLEKEKPQLEYFFESYFQYLLEMFARISGLNIGCYKSIMFRSFEFALSSFGKVPRPNFFLTRGSTILAVLEAKSAEKLHFASHKGHRPKSHKDRQNFNHAEKLVSVTDQVCPKKKRKIMAVDTDKDPDTDKDTDKDIEESEAEVEVETDETLNDAYDAEETLLEENRKETLPDHVKHLDLEEKKEIRCYMPQLLGQMLACTSVKNKRVEGLQHPFMTQIFGIGMVGFEVQFVMLVLKDASEKILSPTVIDLETSKSIRPYLYVTRRLNLFREADLRIIFRTLYALGTLSRL